jgi:predicted oxidoreductase
MSTTTPLSFGTVFNRMEARIPRLEAEIDELTARVAALQRNEIIVARLAFHIKELHALLRTILASSVITSAGMTSHIPLSAMDILGRLVHYDASSMCGNEPPFIADNE